MPSRDEWDLRLGDCLHPEFGIGSLSGWDHLITDAPYAEGLLARTRTNSKRRTKETIAADSERVGGFERILPRVAACAAIRTRRWAIVFSDVESLHLWRDGLCFGGASLEYIRTGAWVKPDAMPQVSGDRPGQSFEGFTICHARGKKRWNGGGRGCHYPVPRARRRLGCSTPRHPTEKPLALMEALIRDFTDPGDLVCDPFAGHGTTGIAAVRLGRRFIGWERDPEYFDEALRRLEHTRPQPELFGPAHTPRVRQVRLVFQE